MSTGLALIIGLFALALATTAAAFASEGRQRGWRSALLSLGGLILTLIAFTAFILLVIVP